MNFMTTVIRDSVSVSSTAQESLEEHAVWAAALRGVSRCMHADLGTYSRIAVAVGWRIRDCIATTDRRPRASTVYFVLYLTCNVAVIRADAHEAAG